MITPFIFSNENRSRSALDFCVRLCLVVLSDLEISTQKLIEVIVTCVPSYTIERTRFLTGTHYKNIPFAHLSDHLWGFCLASAVAFGVNLTVGLGIIPSLV
jgi:hypothetical protein